MIIITCQFILHERNYIIIVVDENYFYNLHYPATSIMIDACIRHY